VAEAVWVGVDLGTQSVRAVAVSATGELLAVAARPLTSRRHGVRHEQQPREWWEQTADALAEMTGALPPGTVREIRGVAVCSTSGTVLLTDPDGTPRTPGLMYDDTRAGALAAHAQDAGATLWDRLGYRIQPAWALPKLLWWRDQGLLRDDVRLAHQPDVITTCLVGRPVAADTSHALKTGYDLLALRWPTEVFDDLHVDPAVLPPVVMAGSVLGRVGADAAARTGLPEGTDVVAGMTDGCAAQLAAGALSPGEWNSVLGTTLALKGVTPSVLHDPTGAVYSHRAPHGDLWLPGGASSTGAGVVTALFGGEDLDALTERARQVQDVPLCYPLSGHGERFPFVEPQARGFLGTDPLPAGPDEVDDAPRTFAAVCIGVAHLERLCFDLLDDAGADVTGPISFTGGGSRNTWWNQLRCDLLGTTVRIPASAEAAVGMAVLAAGAHGADTSDGADVVTAAGRMVHTRAVLHPDPRRGAELGAGYADFVAALTDRGWLDPRTAAHARKRAAA
jgi:sugar (pentulose or hexulose) kinase